MPTNYANTTWLQLQQMLALRLNDPSFVHWTQAEMQLYLAEALRLWNALTQQWLVEWTTTYDQPNPATLPAWQSTANNLNALVGANPTSPRTQTLTDSDVYTIAQYHLLEPPNGNAAWTGTSQFSLTDFTNALARRRDLLLQLTACNAGPIPLINVTPGTNRIQLPDSPDQSILDVRRIRYVTVNTETVVTPIPANINRFATADWIGGFVRFFNVNVGDLAVMLIFTTGTVTYPAGWTLVGAPSSNTYNGTLIWKVIDAGDVGGIPVTISGIDLGTPLSADYSARAWQEALGRRSLPKERPALKP